MWSFPEWHMDQQKLPRWIRTWILIHALMSCLIYYWNLFRYFTKIQRHITLISVIHLYYTGKVVNYHFHFCNAIYQGLSLEQEWRITLKLSLLFTGVLNGVYFRVEIRVRENPFSCIFYAVQGFTKGISYKTGNETMQD